MAEIYVARHGQNEDNVNNILNGWRDLPLTELGRRQAHDLAEGIKELGLKFDTVYTSPLSRASETAEIVSEIVALPRPIILDDLIERDFGDLSGRPIPEVLDICRDELLITDGITYVLQGHGFETFDHARERARAVIDQVNKAHPDGKVLLVCHGDIGKMLYSVGKDMPWREVLQRFHFGNAELIDIKGEVTHIIKLPQQNL